MAGSIFLETTNGLVEMTETPWEAEARLQELLEKYPNMLAGEQMDEAAPRRWLFISREFGIPGELDSGNRWSLDHLFLDQDAIPTLVEVKRSTDTRIRREVVGQMLDYAANLASNVSAERIRQMYEISLAEDAEPGEQLSRLLGVGVNADDYWRRLSDNIAASKMRLVFLADEFPPELKRIVEFLNRQMSQTDVFAVEVRQYVSPGGTHRTLVPRLVGKVETKSAATQGAGPGPRWTRQRFEEALATEDTEAIPTIRRLIQFAASLTGRDVEWGMGRERGSFTARLVRIGHRLSLFSVYTTDELSINIGWSYQTLARLDPDFTDRIRRRTNAMFDSDFNQAQWQKSWPMLPLAVISRDVAKFEGFMNEVTNEVQTLISTSD